MLLTGPVFQRAVQNLAARVLPVRESSCHTQPAVRMESVAAPAAHWSALSIGGIHVGRISRQRWAVNS